MRRIAASLAVVTAVAAAALAGGGPALASYHTGHTVATSYYLSLGDSLARGVQPNSLGHIMETNQGYPDQLFALLHTANPTLRLVKLGCPGETTGSMITGKGRVPSGIPCTYPAGSQLADALIFLKAHPGAVQLVTIDIGANDLVPCVGDDGIPPTSDLNKITKCLQATVPSVLNHLGIILAALRHVDPGAIIAMSYYDPGLVNWLPPIEGRPTYGPAFARATASLAGTFDADLAGVYKRFGVPVANVFGAFETSRFMPMVHTPPFGPLPLNVSRICTWTWECAPPPVGPNEHANKVGYGVIARAFLATYNPYLGAGAR